MLQDASRQLLLDDVQLASLLDRFKLASTSRAALEQRVRIGSYVTLMSANCNESLEIQLVEPCDSHPSRNRISYFSPLGAALVGLRIGSEVDLTAPKGAGQWIVSDVRQRSGDV
ncbi:MAG: GreA/GreB family elongation factor [Idiomarina sp.]|nr:GreA/GreB family elongation factor [Idiomarina sp.]